MCRGLRASFKRGGVVLPPAMCTQQQNCPGSYGPLGSLLEQCCPPQHHGPCLAMAMAAGQQDIPHSHSKGEWGERVQS